MNQRMQQVSRDEIFDLISVDGPLGFDKNHHSAFNRCLRITTMLWVGKVEDELICFWGLIPATMLDDRAYIWLHVTPAVKDNEFIFVRQSQIAIKEMLKRFHTLYGHCEVGAERSARWLRWLGATFGEPEDKLIPFWIVRKE